MDYFFLRKDEECEGATSSPRIAFHSHPTKLETALLALLPDPLSLTHFYIFLVTNLSVFLSRCCSTASAASTSTHYHLIVMCTPLSPD